MALQPPRRTCLALVSNFYLFMLVMVISLPPKRTCFASLRIPPKLHSRDSQQGSDRLRGYNPITTLFSEGWLSFIQPPSRIIEITAKTHQKGGRGGSIEGSYECWRGVGGGILYKWRGVCVTYNKKRVFRCRSENGKNLPHPPNPTKNHTISKANPIPTPSTPSPPPPAPHLL